MIRYPDGNVLLRNLTRAYPVVSYGQGPYLYDTNGKKYFDGAGGALVMSLGHGHRAVCEAIHKQMLDVAYVNGQQFTSQVMEDFARELVHYAPRGLNRVALLASGSEAVEAAIKFCRQLWVERKEPKRTKLIARSPGYHGNTLFALSASAREHYKKFFGPLLSEVHMVSAPYEYRSPVKDYHRDAAAFYADELEKKIKAVGADEVMAFICEPVIGSSAGASCPPHGYFEAIQKVCRRYGILMIADEILCGSGRSGKFFACEHFGFEPDVAVLGKGINGGYVPMSALLIKDEHLKEMKAGSGYFMHAQTYLQAPVMAAAGLAVLKAYRDEKVLENASQLGAYFQEQLRKELGSMSQVGFVAGIGMLAGVELVEDRASKKPFDRSKKVIESFVNKAFEAGLIVWPNVGHADGVNGDLFMLGPPLNSTRAQIDELIELVKKVLGASF